MSFFADFLNSPEKLYSFTGAAAAVSIPLLVNTCKDFYFDFQKRKTERNYLVVQLIYLLDDFVFNCGEVCWDQGFDPNYPQPDDHEYEAQTKDPVFDMSSVKGDHKYLEPMMLYKLQGINVEIAKSKEKLREITNEPSFDYEDVKYFFEQRRREFANIGLKASHIADELRINFKVPYRDEWNPRDTIIKSINQMDRQRAVLAFKRMERKAKFIMAKHNKETILPVNDN